MTALAPAPPTRALDQAVSAAASLLAPALTMVAVALAALPWLRAYQVAGATTYLVIAAAAPVVIATVLADRLGQPPPVTYGASLLGLLILAVVLGGGHPGAAWHGLTQDPTRLLTETLPLNGSAAVLTGPVVLTWVCGTATAELSIRIRRSAVGLGVPAICFVLAYAATSPAPGSENVPGPLLLATLALAAVVHHRSVEASRGVIDVSADASSRPGSAGPGGLAPGTRGGGAGGGYTPGLRAAGTGAALALVAAAILGVGLPAVPGLATKPTSLARPIPRAAGVLIDPVDAVASLRDTQPRAAARPQFTVTTEGAAPGYFGIAILDRYNGGSWTFDTTFHPTGGRIPPAPIGSPGAVTDAAAPVTQRYRFDPGYTLPFMPTLDRPRQVDGLAADADASTGMVIPSRTGSLPRTYTTVSQTPLRTLAAAPAVDGIGTVRGALDPVQVADTALPAGTATDIGDATRFLATLTGRRPAPTVAFLQDVQRSLRNSERRINRAARPATGAAPATATGGTSLAQVINAVAVVKAATPEQFATLFVMVARYLGVPARLVTGFRVPDQGGAAGVIASGPHQLTNRDAWTWAEIPVAGLGWVIADPTPDATTGAAAAPPQQVQVTPTTLLPRQANAVPQNQIVGGHAIAKPVHVHLSHPHHSSRAMELLLAILIAIVVLGGAGPTLAAIRRGVRRRARRSLDPAHLAVGAWLELLDGLHRCGMRASGGATTSEIATSAGQHFGEAVVAPVRELGAVADQALFALSRPPDPPTAEQAWQTARDVRRQVVATLDRRQRLRALVVVGETPRRTSRPEG